MRVRMVFLSLSAALLASSVRADDLVSLSKDPKQWVMPARDYASTRFSPLDRINASNVGRLQAAWMFSVGTQHGQEAAPLVVKGEVFGGVSGGERGVRRRITALDENTGKIDYLAYSTGPDKDVLIGSDFSRSMTS